MFKFTVSALLLCIAFACPSFAATDLAMSCEGTPTGTRLNQCVTLKWAPIEANRFYASCISTCTWNSADAAWRRGSELPPDAKVLRCKRDIAVSNPFRAGLAGVDPCPDSDKQWQGSTNEVQRLARWKAPTTNEDGTVLTDLAGYRLSIAESELGPWRQVAAPAASTPAMSVTVSATPRDRCAQLVARTGAGSESKPLVACLKGSPPMAGEDFSFE